MRLLQAVGAGLHRQPAGDFRHRRQQRQPPFGCGDGFIGDADGAAGVDQVGTLLGVGRQVQVGVQDLPLAQHRALAGLRLLDLDDHLGTGEDLLGGFAAIAAPAFDVDLVGGADAAVRRPGLRTVTRWPCATISRTDDGSPGRRDIRGS
jgi:hypothetical protein